MKNSKFTGRRTFFLIIVAAISVTFMWAFLDEPRPHNPKVFDPPEKTQWKPIGARSAGQHNYDIIPEPTTWHAIHVDVSNADSVWGVAAPMFELDWVAEPAYFVGSGPLLDNQGNLYFSANFYHGERVDLVAIDAKTGERRWSLPEIGKMSAGGPIILNDPDNPGSQIIYLAGPEQIRAVRQDGSIIWDKATGIRIADTEDRDTASFQNFNYHPATDSLVTVTKAGGLYAFSRTTGNLITTGQIPGSPAISSKGTSVPSLIVNRVDPLMDEAFGKTAEGLSLFSAAVNYLYGGGGVVTNYFSIDPDSSRIYIAATAPDAEDGTEDGRSEIGAIYVIGLQEDSNGSLEFNVLNRKTFQGGTGSTPALSADGSRVYVSDNEGHVITLDSELQEIWKVNVGEPLVGSITVAADNNEIYAVTQNDVFQLIDHGDSGAVGWTAELNGFDGYANVDVQSNGLTATATANGVVIMIGGGKKIVGRTVMLHVGMGLLDRKTGKLRYFTEGREDSLAMSVVAADGSIYVGHSPLRRAVGKALFPELTGDVTGGVARFKPVRLDLLARDAICAAGARAANADTLDKTAETAAISADTRQIGFLITQAENAIEQAVSDSDMTQADANPLRDLLAQSSASLATGDLTTSATALASACTMFD
ncbi:PQQ-binding-like beta-propeller repeat protein [Halioglobus sp.]|nr:PQQ-binding-like beta-propeller repeat protein [Halioglobus sp.]